MGAVPKLAVETMDTREALLAAAQQIFSRKGYHGTNVSDIVSAVGMAQGSFYNYFRNKKGIFQEILQAFVDQIIAAVEAVDLNTIKDATSYHLVGVALGTKLSRIFLEGNDLAQIFLREAAGMEPEFDAIVNNAYRRVTDASQAYVEQGQKVGVVRLDISSKVTANAMVGMCSYMIDRAMRGEFEGQDPNELLQTLVSIHLRGILI